MHLQISEALERTIGEDYRRKLYDYEVSKTDEIYNYMHDKSSVKCIKHMHEKLQTYMKFMKKHNHGCVSFTYGEDVFADMDTEELEYMNKSYEIGIDLKGAAVVN